MIRPSDGPDLHCCVGYEMRACAALKLPRQRPWASGHRLADVVCVKKPACFPPKLQGRRQPNLSPRFPDGRPKPPTRMPEASGGKQSKKPRKNCNFSLDFFDCFPEAGNTTIFPCPSESGRKYLLSFEALHRNSEVQEMGLLARVWGAEPQPFPQRSGFKPARFPAAR